ncbi:hypothetical protein NL108_018190 [Boleophthalmus pectinirostris]|nr:hypothetical protein NL108_018190 [Boleophthalmus pectinirostris]
MWTSASRLRVRSAGLGAVKTPSALSAASASVGPDSPCPPLESVWHLQHWPLPLTTPPLQAPPPLQALPTPLQAPPTPLQAPPLLPEAPPPLSLQAPPLLPEAPPPLSLQAPLPPSQRTSHSSSSLSPDASSSVSGSSPSSTGSSHSSAGSSPSARGSSPSSHSPDASSSAGSSPFVSRSSPSSHSPDASSSASGSSHSSAGSSPSVSRSSPSSHSPDASSSASGSSPSVSRASPPVSGSSPSVSGSSPSVPGPSSLSPDASPLPLGGRGELRECYYDLDSGVCSVLSSNTTAQECCCTEGRGWGRGCVYHTCPLPHTDEFRSLCPNGRGYVTTGPGAFDYTDVDECKRFGPEVCKSGVCVNNIPGFSCYCPSGYTYNRTLLECSDHDECEEESCSGGLCVNTQGSFYCSCPHPLVLDDTQRNCVNATPPALDENVSLCWQHVSADLLCQSLLLRVQLSFSDCCCLYGQGWGLECALCPRTDTEDYARLCSSVQSPVYPELFPDPGTGPGSRAGPGPAREGPPVPYFPPFSSELYPPALDYDDSRGRYDDSAPAGGGRGGYDPGYIGSPYGGGYYPEPDYDPDTPYSPDGSRFSPDGSRFSPDGSSFSPDGSSFSPDGSRFSPDGSSFSPDGSRFSPDGSRFSPDGSRFSPDGSRFSPDGSRFGSDSRPFLVPPDPRSEEAFEVQTPPASERFYPETREEDWSRFPPFTRPGLRRVYDRRFEAVEEDCGIADGCVNGRCIRVAEGYTCDCYHGYELDLTSMTCTDVNECEGGVRLEFPCINARCVNTEGSYRCVCRRGYVLSNRPNYCVSA